MTLEESILLKLRVLPVDKKQAVLDFVEFLNSKTAPHGARRSVKGLLADLNVDLTADDIDAARRDMWVSFPRDIEL